MDQLYLKQQAYATLFSVTNKLQAQGDSYFNGLTSRQFMTLLAIVHIQKGEATLNNIARKLGTTKQSLKQIIIVLERKKFTLAVPSSTDKRAVNVQLTDIGSEALQQYYHMGNNFLDDLFHDFSDEETEMLWFLLKKLYRFDGEEQDGFEEEGKL